MVAPCVGCFSAVRDLLKGTKATKPVSSYSRAEEELVKLRLEVDLTHKLSEARSVSIPNLDLEPLAAPLDAQSLSAKDLQYSGRKQMNSLGSIPEEFEGNELELERETSEPSTEASFHSSCSGGSLSDFESTFEDSSPETEQPGVEEEVQSTTWNIAETSPRDVTSPRDDPMYDWYKNSPRDVNADLLMTAERKAFTERIAELKNRCGSVQVDKTRTRLHLQQDVLDKQGRQIRVLNQSITKLNVQFRIIEVGNRVSQSPRRLQSPMQSPRYVKSQS
jgi:hypothetical protein